MGILLRDLAHKIEPHHVPYLRKLQEQIDWHLEQEELCAEQSMHFDRSARYLLGSEELNLSTEHMLISNLHSEERVYAERGLLHARTRMLLEQARDAYVSKQYKIDLKKQRWHIDLTTNTIYRLPDESYFHLDFKTLAAQMVKTFGIPEQKLMDDPHATVPLEALQDIATRASEAGTLVEGVHQND